VAAPKAPVPPHAPTGDGIRQLVFADADNGWAFGGALYSTHDGGRHWSPVPIRSGAITAIAVAGPTVYALDEACDAAGTMCQLGHLLQSPVRRDAFEPVPGLHRLGVPGHVFAGSLAAHDTAVYLLAQLDSRLWLWHPDGRLWRRHALPCQPADGLGDAAWAVASRGRVVLVCGGEPGAGNELKRGFVSPDAGLDWRALGPLPFNGYVESLAAPTPTTLVLARGRSGLLVSDDGGESWREAFGPGDGDGWRFVSFPTAQFGFALPYAQPSDETPVIAVTHDGGRTWTAVHVG